MSTSIRPPGGFTSGVGAGSLADGGSDISDASGLTGTAQSEGAQSLHGAGQTLSSQASEAGQAARGEAAASESAAGGWIQRLEAGEISRSEAVEGLVADAVQKHGGARLSPAMRGELENVLRTALKNDPVLSRLLGGA